MSILDRRYQPSYAGEQMAKATNLKPGTQLSVEAHGDSPRMTSTDSDLPDWRSMRGMFKDGPDLLKDLEMERGRNRVRCPG
jgi:hypothetical protein